MKKSFVLAAVVLIAIFFGGCSGLQEVSVGNIKSFEIKGFENNKLNLEIVVPVENPNPYRVKVKGAGIKVMNGDTELGQVTQMDNVIISGKTEKDYPVNLTVELTGLKNSNLFSMYRALKNNGDLRITGEVRASYFLLSRAIKFDYPISY